MCPLPRTGSGSDERITAMEFGPMEQMSVLANEVRQIAQTETVIGEPIHAGESTIVPVISVSIGFGAGGVHGGQSGTKATGSGGGGGAGISLTPVAFLVVTGDDVRLLPIKESAVRGLAASVPRIVDALIDRKKGSRDTGGSKTADAEEPTDE